MIMSENKVKWTDDQRNAIELEGNLLVSAAAGAGKTKVMTERIVRIISEGTKVEELLVVTFTRAAAAEMKERIENRLNELSEEEKDPQKRLLLMEAASNITRANISTIHGFCLNVLKRNYHLIGIDPAFRTADPSEAAMLLLKAVEEVTEQFYLEAEKNKDPISQFIIRAYHKNGGIGSMLLKLYKYIVARPEPELWLEKAVENYDSDFETAATAAENYIVSVSKRDADAFYSMYSELYEESANTLDEVHRKLLEEDMNLIFSLSMQNSYEGWRKALREAEIPTNKKKQECPPDITRLHEKAASFITDKAADRFILSRDQERTAAKALYPALVKIKEMLFALMERYRELKQQEAVIDFNDMEQYTFSILKNEEQAEEYRNRFRYIFVDEYQDTNLVQDSIISRISRGDNLFMVGDVKQSIYRFRQAEPASFIKKYNSYKEASDIGGAEGAPGRRINLNYNFRSALSILNITNTLFSKLMLGEVGEIEYTEDAKLRSLDPEKALNGYAELALIEMNKDEYESAAAGDCPWEKKDKTKEKAAVKKFDDEPLENVEAESAYIAKTILDLIGQKLQVFDTDIKQYRDIRLSDFAVLMRKARDVAFKVVNSLGERGIPCVAELGDGFFDAIEVQVFMNLLRIIDNVRQDIPLVSVLRSPIGGFTDEEIVRLRTDFEGFNFFDCFIAAAKAEESELAEENRAVAAAAKKMYNRILKWRVLSRDITTEALIGRLLDETKYYIFIGALKGGEVRQANLDLLIEKARAFEKAGRRTLHSFLTLMDNVRDNSDLGAAQAAGMDAVRVMSIHSSKGLEFPVVFICGLGSDFNNEEKKSHMMLDSELGIGLRIGRGMDVLPGIGDLREKEAGKTLFRRAIEVKEDSRRSSEEMRVLYVGMTRARERLYMVAAKSGMATFVHNSAKRLNKHRVVYANGFLNWIIGAFYPFGFNLQNAVNGVDSDIGGSCLRAYYLPGSAAEKQDVRLKKDGFKAWTRMAKEADHEAADRALEFRYPYMKEAGTEARSSVTGRSAADFDYVPAVPGFIAEKKLTGADRGTFTHRFIMMLPLRATGADELRSLLEEATRKGFFTKEEAAMVDLDSVRALTESPLYRRMIISGSARREQEFSMLEESGALMQGIIDCFFIENGEAVLIDYKTTSVKGREPREVAEQYRGQIDRYARAITLLSGAPVKEKWIYLMAINEAILL